MQVFVLLSLEWNVLSSPKSVGKGKMMMIKRLVKGLVDRHLEIDG